MKAGTLKLEENWNIKLVDIETNKVLSEENICNTLTNVGRGVVAQTLLGLTSDTFTALAVGTGTTGASATDTTLETEVLRETATLSNPSTYVARLYKEFTFGSSYAITEAGVFNSTTASGSSILARTTFSAKNVSTTVKLQITADITIGTV